jgi:hypothetical protein
MSKILTIVLLLFSLNVSAAEEYSCDAHEVLKVTAAAVTAGVVVGAAAGAVTAFIMPVGGVGGPMAIAYFPASTAFWSWIKLSVIPVAAATGLAVGTITGTVAYMGVSVKCGGYLDNQARKALATVK